MNLDINDMVTKYTICLEHRKENTKEPMIPFRIPCNLCEMVAIDLFALDKLDYLLIVDHYSSSLKWSNYQIPRLSQSCV